MDFFEFFMKHVKDFAWGIARYNGPNGNRTIKSIISNNKKRLFIEALDLYYKQYGIDCVINQKNQILKAGKYGNVNILTILRIIRNQVGQEAMREFYYKKNIPWRSVFYTFTVASLILMVGIFIGVKFATFLRSLI